MQHQGKAGDRRLDCAQGGPAYQGVVGLHQVDIADGNGQRVDACGGKGGGLSEEFVREFAVVGTPDQCTRRLLELKAMGLERFVVVGPGFYPANWGEAAGLFAREVMPALRAGA